MRLSSRLVMIPLLAIILLAIGTILPSAPAAASRPPNIVFILTDDLSLDEIAYMPKMKSLLMNQGTSFSNYFVSVSLCCPSRSTTLRGQYSHNTGIETNAGGNGGFETAYRTGLESSTVATWLQGGDYRTGLFGKYLNGYPSGASNTYIPPGWTDWNSSVIGNAYEEFNYTLNENGAMVPFAKTPEDYGTDVYSGLAVNFIQQSVQAEQPFFVYLGVYAPHQPATPAPRDASLFPGAQAPRTPNYDETDVRDKPEYIASRRLLTPQDIKAIDGLYRKRIQSLQAVDDAIEQIYNTLQADGQLDNTYIIFTSDNGFHLGNHRMPAGKQTAYEEDIHLPLVVRGPGIAAGKTVDQITGNVDLAPTIAAMGGVTTPDYVDGRSFLPLLQGTVPTNWRQVFLVEHWKQAEAPPGQVAPAPDSLEPDDLDQQSSNQSGDATPTADTDDKLQEVVRNIPEYHGIRGLGYVYIEYVTGEKEFYNLTTDPYELTNLAAKLDPASQQALSERVAELSACKTVTCRSAENAWLTFTMPTG